MALTAPATLAPTAGVYGTDDQTQRLLGEYLRRTTAQEKADTAWIVSQIESADQYWDEQGNDRGYIRGLEALALSLRDQIAAAEAMIAQTADHAAHAEAMLDYVVAQAAIVTDDADGFQLFAVGEDAGEFILLSPEGHHYPSAEDAIQAAMDEEKVDHDQAA